MSKFKYSYPKRYSIEHLLKKISSDISIFSLFYRIFYFFILFLPSLSFSETGKTEFDSIQKVAQYILNNYPKNKTVYIGVGRSPVPVIAYLQTEEGTLTQNLPLSNFRYNLSKYPKLDSEESLRLYSHFNNYFPSESKLLGRNEILLIDYSVTGKTLTSTQEHLDQYFKVYQKKISKIHALGIASQQNENKLKSLSPSLDVFILNGYPSLYLNLDQFDPFLFMMAFELYKDRAEFEGFNIKNPRQLRPRKKYEDYVLEIKSSKLKHLLGLLNDEWTQGLFEFFCQPKKYEFENSLLNQWVDKLSDFEFIGMINTIITKIVDGNRLENRKSEIFLEYKNRSCNPKDSILTQCKVM